MISSHFHQDVLASTVFTNDAPADLKTCTWDGIAYVEEFNEQAPNPFYPRALKKNRYARQFWGDSYFYDPQYGSNCD
jgi:hypothetical protein